MAEDKNKNLDVEQNSNQEGGAGANSDPGNEAGANSHEKEKKPQKTYTDEEVNRIIDSKFAELKSKLEEQQAEAEKLKNMNDSEKLEYELEQAKLKIADFEKKESRLNMKKEARTMLEAANIRLEDGLIDVLVTDKAETTKTAITAFIESFNDAVEERTKELLSGETPRGTKGKPKITKEEIEAIKNPVERQQKIAENLELFI